MKVSQSCPTLCDPTDYTVHGIPQARILEWVAVPFCRGSSQPRDRAQVSHIAGGFFTSWASRETLPSSCVFPVTQPPVWGAGFGTCQGWFLYSPIVSILWLWRLTFFLRESLKDSFCLVIKKWPFLVCTHQRRPARFKWFSCCLALKRLFSSS